MKTQSNRTLTVLLVAVLLVGGVNVVAFGANGGKFLLGKVNKESKASVLKNTGHGPALNLRTRASAPPLKVSSKKRVQRLNADLVDGKSASQLQTRSRVYRIPAQSGVSGFELTLPGMTPGLYSTSFSVIAQMSASGARINCHFTNPETAFYELMGYGSIFGDYSTSNASGVIDTRSSPKIFRCFTSGGTATVDADFDEQSQIVLTRIDRVTETPAAEAVRVVPRTVAPGARIR